MITVEINDAYKEIKGNVILNHVNMQLKSGHIYGFWGKNASGKTMLFRAITGLIYLNHGEIKVFGQTIGKDTDYPNDLGLIIENIGLWNDYTGFENLKLLASINNKINDEEIKNTLSRVGLDPDDKRKYKKYSLGMKQKLAIAQAIMEKPKLLVLDEPTNALDEESCKNVRNILVEQKERGATVLIASHNRDDIDALADEIYQVSSGKVSIMNNEKAGSKNENES
ncbi:ATP-binding cassette domain-containing protein [Paludicola sp. MB14-C6]|uniref:ABC transporter ATP-binding protein n=1 Tax=Paludihabitans sp. MB14-C6 TaxID=3070656 RepID=UPI0027DDE7CF|nr:ATP-binding cassette domain-containing protein [Paludicola sp. MB14-C6]WMJ22645.1 ATP-binding cassette domain-containing protein [Paludicola sp. MB14-C6]